MNADMGLPLDKPGGPKWEIIYQSAHMGQLWEQSGQTMVGKCVSVHMGSLWGEPG